MSEFKGIYDTDGNRIKPSPPKPSRPPEYFYSYKGALLDQDGNKIKLPRHPEPPRQRPVRGSEEPWLDFLKSLNYFINRAFIVLVVFALIYTVIK